MIVEAILRWIAAVASGLLAQLPIPVVPAWAADVAGMISTMLGYVGRLCGWVSWDLVPIVVPAVVLAWLGGLTLKILRIVYSMLWPGGGATS